MSRYDLDQKLPTMMREELMGVLKTCRDIIERLEPAGTRKLEEMSALSKTLFNV